MTETSATPGVEQPERIGQYRILDALGEGGMGVVYLAEQMEPVRRRVALKIIKRGMDTKQVIARFEAEEQALALMNHPNVAKVFDAGATQQGRPYFVMEYVPGIPITEYCDLRCLGIRTRLELFVQVCEAIHHAHQKGIIHRDIKPSNILVASVEGKSSLKVIDFGVAKATSQRLTEQSLFTQRGILIGTPEYMSPEQAGTTALDVDTRTDIYSLGVLLYELLVGTLPFDPVTLRRAGPVEMLRIIREEDPPRLVTKLSELEETAAEVAKRRHTDVRSLRKRLRGELDWITIRAMEKDPSRRYASASELAADVRRHLQGEYIVAGPPSAAYRLGKIFQRHRTSVLFAAALTLALVVGFTLSTYLLFQTVKAESKARAEARRMELLFGFLTDLITGSEPGRAPGKDLTIQEMLDLASERAATDFAYKPLVRARFLEGVGRLDMALGRLDRAERSLEHALKIRRETLPGSHPEIASNLEAIGRLYGLQGRPQEALAPLNQALDMLEGSQFRSPHSRLAETLSTLAAIHDALGNSATASEYLERALSVDEEIHGAHSAYLSKALDKLAGLYKLQGRLVEAEGAARRALALEEGAKGPEDPAVASSMARLAEICCLQGRFREAEPLYRQAMSVFEQAPGANPAAFARALRSWAACLRGVNRHSEALEMEDRAHRIEIRRDPDADPATVP